MIAGSTVMTMAALPKACHAVLQAPEPVSEAAVTVGGMGTAVAQAPARQQPVTQTASESTIEAILGAPPVAASAFAPTPESGIPLPFPKPAR